MTGWLTSFDFVLRERTALALHKGHGEPSSKTGTANWTTVLHHAVGTEQPTTAGEDPPRGRRYRAAGLSRTDSTSYCGFEGRQSRN